MATRDTPYLTTDTFLHVMIKKNFITISGLVITVVSGNRYLSKSSSGNVLCITNPGNVFVARYVILLVTITFFYNFVIKII